MSVNRLPDYLEHMRQAIADAQSMERKLDNLTEQDATLDALWAKEADDRLAAYRRGELRAVLLSDAIAKCQTTKVAA